MLLTIAPPTISANANQASFGVASRQRSSVELQKYSTAISKKMSATKLAGGSKNAYKLNASRDSSARAKARWPEIKANFTLAKLNADSAIGGGKKAKGTRYYDQRDLINLAVDKGGDSCMAPIQDLQQRVLDLYK